MRLPVGVACGGRRRPHGMRSFLKRRVLGSTSSTTNRSHALFFGLSAYRRIPDLQAWNGNSLPPIPMQTPDHKQDEKSGWSRLKQVIDWSGMSVNRFAGAVGLQRSESLYQIKKGKNGISRRLASRILEHYPQINFTWLMTGKGHMLAEEKTDLFKIPITLRLTSEEAHDLLDLLKKMLEKPAPPDDRPL